MEIHPENQASFQVSMTVSRGWLSFVSASASSDSWSKEVFFSSKSMMQAAAALHTLSLRLSTLAYSRESLD